MRNHQEDAVMVNLWGDVQVDGPVLEYYSLMDIIDFKEFRFDHTYREQEKELLQPQLEALGYNVIKWVPGEQDCFGPLTRLCQTSRGSGEHIWFVYG
jgi:hypothetical protein